MACCSHGIALEQAWHHMGLCNHIVRIDLRRVVFIDVRKKYCNIQCRFDVLVLRSSVGAMCWLPQLCRASAKIVAGGRLWTDLVRCRKTKTVELDEWSSSCFALQPRQI